MSTANRNHHAPPTPQHDDKIYSHEPQSREELERVSPQHLIAAIANNHDNVHPSWWWALQDKPDLHHHRAQAIAHIDPNIAEKNIARWCAKVIEHGYQSVLTILHDRRHLLWDFLPPPTNSHIDPETHCAVASSIAYSFLRFHKSQNIDHHIDHRACQWLNAALIHNAKTSNVKKLCQRLCLSFLYSSGATDEHSFSGYQARDRLCFLFGSTQATIDFLQRVPLKNQTERDARDRLCHILAEEHHDPAPYQAPHMPLVKADSSDHIRLWEKIWHDIHHEHQTMQSPLRRELEPFFRQSIKNNTQLTIDTVRAFATHATTHAQRGLAKTIIFWKHQSNLPPSQTAALDDIVLAPLLDHDPRSVPETCCGALIGRILEQGRMPGPAWGKMSLEIFSSCGYATSPEQRTLAAAWALARTNTNACTRKEKEYIAEIFIRRFSGKDFPSFSQVWEKNCSRQEQQQHLLQHPAALLLPTPEQDANRYCKSPNTYKQAVHIIGDAPVAAVSVLAALPTDVCPPHSTSVLELIARSDRSSYGRRIRHALVEHFGHETLCGALTSLLLTTENERQRQDAAQALAYLSQENRP